MSVVRVHDFRRSESLDRQYVRALSAAFDTFARHGSVELSTSLRKPCQLSAPSLREIPWREVTELRGERPYLATFNLDPLHGPAVFSLPLRAAIRMLDFRLGGGTQPSFGGHTDMTETDFAVLAGVVTPLLVEVGASLSRVKEVAATLVAQESSIQFVQFAGPNEMFLVATFQLGIAEDDPVDLVLALPFALVRQITEAMRSASLARDDATLLVDESVVLRVPVEVWLEIPAVPLSSTEVSEVKVGDVIRFFHPLRQPLDVRADGVLVGRARQGSVGSKVVCSILEEVSTDGE